MNGQGLGARKTKPDGMRLKRTSASELPSGTGSIFRSWFFKPP
jgi:hypothetical protein